MSFCHRSLPPARPLPPAACPTDFEEIAAAGLPLPSLTQSPFHLYRSATQMDILNYCNRNGITFLGYSPFGGEARGRAGGWAAR